MQLKIAVIDTETSGLVTQEMFAANSTISRSYLGGDSAFLGLVASELKWTFIDLTNQPATLQSLFTSKDNKYRIELTENVSGAVLGKYYLVPDLYQEEYRYKPTIAFEAVCGLGLLKSRYFEKDFYKEEQSVIDIFSKCFAAIGLGINFSFSPGIENSTEKDFTKITIDMLHYYNEDKEDYTSMYDVLTEVVESLQSICFQENNQWHVLGVNKRFLKEYETKIYSDSGALLSTTTVTRNIVIANPQPNPLLTVTSALNEVKIDRELNEFNIPEEAYKLVNRGYVPEIELNEILYPKEWIGYGGVNPKAHYKDLVVYLDNLHDASVTYKPAEFVCLKKKIGVKKAQKVQVNLKFKARTNYQNDTALEDWLDKNPNPIKFEILLNGSVQFSNITGTSRTTSSEINFDNNLSAEAFYSFNVPNDGVLDIKIYQPYYTSTSSIVQAYEFTEFKIEDLEEPDDTEIYTHPINSDYTNREEFSLAIADDVSAISKSFLTVKNREYDTSYEAYDITVFYSFTVNGEYFSVVSLYDAMQIDAFRGFLYNGATNVLVSDVIYNYNASEQMLFKTDSLIASNTTLTLRVTPYKSNVAGREYSETWTDAVYPIENDRFIVSFAKVVERLRKTPTQFLEGSFLKLIGFNDLLQFTYTSAQTFYPTNLTQDLSKGITRFTGLEALYNDATTINIPPIVQTASEVVLPTVDTSIVLTATASDPDGSIDTILWEQVFPVSPLATIVDSDSLSTTVNNLTEDFYRFQVTVTDNNGLQAVATTEITRDVAYAIDLVEQSNTVNASNPESKLFVYRVSSTPSLEQSVSVNLNFDLAVLTTADPGAYSFAYIKIIKNGLLIYTHNETAVESAMLNIGYIESDVIDIEMYVEGWYETVPEDYSATATMILQTADITTGSGSVTGPPITKTINI